MGNTPYMVIINYSKTFNLTTGTYFIGSAMIMKGDENGLSMLTEDEYDTASKEFTSRLVTLTGNGQDYSAYELA